MKSNVITVLIAVFMPLIVQSQQQQQILKGELYNEKNKPIPDAQVYWKNDTNAIFSDISGKFNIPKKVGFDTLIIYSVGYKLDTLVNITTNNIVVTLKPVKDLKEILVIGNSSGIQNSNNSIIKTEQITQGELKKSACCDLSGCFETQLTVQPQTTNVITNAKELRILGLSGVYNQVLFNGFPLIQGASYTYGISSIPGTLVDNIYVSKGANSVLQGFESISGQINVEPKNPFNTERLLANAYINSFGEKHFNINVSVKKNKWAHIIAAQIVSPSGKIDKDKDQFLDLPLLNRYLLYNNWRYGNENSIGWFSNIGIRFLNEKRIGGQVHFNAKEDKGSGLVYGQHVTLNQQEAFTKTGYRFNEKNQLTMFASTLFHQQTSYFGTLNYQPNQKNVYLNLQYEHDSKLGILKTGISYRYLNIQEDIDFTGNAIGRTYDGKYVKNEFIPGVFAEQTFRFFDNRLTWLMGVRGDWLNGNNFHLTPRTLLKWDWDDAHVFRANIGTGWRTVNLFSEHISLLASSRNIIIQSPLLAERALNWGMNFTKKFNLWLGQSSGQLSFDFYQTQFMNQIFPDYDSDATVAQISNFNGNSKSNGFQTEVILLFLKRFEYKAGYTFLDVYRKINGEKVMLPFNPKHKIIQTFSYKPLHNKFHIDGNFHWFGKQKLPNTQSNPLTYQRPDFSKNYLVVGLQFTYKIKQFDFYGGIENLFDFRQLKPIISWQQPYSTYFDVSSVWGPTRGREFYLGVRFKIS